MPTKPSVIRLRDAAPQAATHYLTAPYALFRNREMSLVEIKQLISPYLNEAGDTYERFPETQFGHPATDRYRHIKRDDSESLAKRGDIYALFAILALVREAEAKRDDVSHLRHLRALYVCLPALGRFSWLRPDFGLLCMAIRRVHVRMKCSADTLGVDWNIISEQFDDPGFEPDPALRPTDPDTGCPVAISDPTFLIKVRSRGQMPEWIGEDADRENEEQNGGATPLKYKEINEMHGDQLLFMAFMQTMHLWDIRRSNWEACLGVRSATLTSWIDFGVSKIGFIPRIRILALIIIKALLHRDPDYQSDCPNAIRLNRPLLNGESVLDYLRAGRILQALRHFDKDPAIAGPVGTAGVFPLVPAGVFRLPRELTDLAL